jgi:hypothetical protein
MFRNTKDDDLVLFIEVNHYTIPVNRRGDSGNVSIGLALISFLALPCP